MKVSMKVSMARSAQAMAPRLSSSLRLIDFFRLGGAMPEEVATTGDRWDRLPGKTMDSFKRFW